MGEAINFEVYSANENKDLSQSRLSIP